MTIEIGAYGGTLTDITSMIKNQGVSWSFNSVDADGSGRDLSGVMHRTQIAIKGKLEFKCVPLTSTQMKTLRTILANQWLTVKITTNAETLTYKMYPGATISTAVLRSYGNNELWGDFSFNTIEE